MRRFLIAVFGIALSSTLSHARSLSPVEWQFINAVQEEQIDKAKSLIELAGINPNDLGGKPIISMVAQRSGHVHVLSDETWSFLINDLHQDVNAQFWDQKRTVFSTLCVGMHTNSVDQLDEAIFKRTLARINAALAAGASAKEFPGANPSDRDSQPIWTCVNEFRAVAGDPRFTGPALNLVIALLSHGANPNYPDFGGGATVTSVAAEMLQPALLRTLVLKGGRIDRVFPATSSVNTCPVRPIAYNTILDFVPDPADRDVDRARIFLSVAVDLGADIKARQTRTWMQGTCQRADNTLKERALNLGQIAYAKMVLDLEKRPRGKNPYAGHAPGSEAPEPAGAQAAVPAKRNRHQETILQAAVKQACREKADELGLEGNERNDFLIPCIREVGLRLNQPQ